MSLGIISTVAPYLLPQMLRYLSARHPDIQLHVPLLSAAQQANVRPLTDPEPSREIAFVVHRNFVRERLLNILSDAVRSVIPVSMVYARHRKFPIVI